MLTENLGKEARKKVGLQVGQSVRKQMQMVYNFLTKKPRATVIV
jgi:hypothetical protein